MKWHFPTCVQDKKPNTEVLKRLGLTHLRTMIVQKRLRRLWHVKRMDDSRIPKTVLFSEALRNKVVIEIA